MNVQQIIDQAANIAKYIQMIENQVQQIQTLTDQLNEFKHYESLFGDPKAVLLILELVGQEIIDPNTPVLTDQAERDLPLFRIIP